MQAKTNDRTNLFAGRSNPGLASKICECYGQELGKTTFVDFKDGEFEICFDDTIRGSHVFIIQSTFSPLENLFELLMMIDAAKRASAKQIVAVIPYFAFARQDRKSKPRVAISAKLIANLLTAAGVNRIIALDLHSDQIQGFFDIPVDHLYASSVIIPYLKSKNLADITMASPDTGGAKRAAAYAKYLETDLVICFKQRVKANEVSNMVPIGNVKGKDIILIDDIIDTAGTITAAGNIMMDMGANSVRAACTHAVFSGDAYEKIERSQIQEFIVTDSIPLKQKCDKITVLSTADLFADVIQRVTNCESISTHFNLNTIL